MANAESFCRIENKYLLPEKDIPFFRAALLAHLSADPYAGKDGSYLVNTIYFDNRRNDVVGRSVAHPTYKEKLRLRSYGGDKPIYFIEFKNKYRCDVFKNRILLNEKEVDDFVFDQRLPKENGQFKHDRFLLTLADFCARHDGIYPHSVIQYRRMAFVNHPFDPYLRVTIDTNLLYRRDNFKLNEPGGKPLLGPGLAILEIKIPSALPLWLAALLNQFAITRDRFSKYGASFLESQGGTPEISLNPLSPGEKDNPSAFFAA